MQSVVVLEVVEEAFTDRVRGASCAKRTVLAALLRHARRGDPARVALMDRLARLAVDLTQLERSLTRERQREGIAIAKTKGVEGGRARPLDAAAVAEAQRLTGAGVPKARIVRDLGCSRRVLYDALGARGAYATLVPAAEQASAPR